MINVFSKIYEIEVLFACLHEHGGNVRPSHSQCTDAFLTSAFDYLPGTRYVIKKVDHSYISDGLLTYQTNKTKTIVLNNKISKGRFYCKWL